jgi:hypothetical protein
MIKMHIRVGVGLLLICSSLSFAGDNLKAARFDKNLNGTITISNPEYLFGGVYFPLDGQGSQMDMICRYFGLGKNQSVTVTRLDHWQEAVIFYALQDGRDAIEMSGPWSLIKTLTCWEK